MNDVEFEQQLKSELHQRADRVRPSADAWASIQAKAGDRTRRSGWLIGTGMVAAGGAAVALGINLLQGPTSVTIGPEPAGTGVATVTPSEQGGGTGAPAVETAEPDAYDWSEVALPTANEYVSAEGIASVGETVMVVGDDPELLLPVVWLSADGGRSFEQVSPEGPSNGSWKDVTAVEGRFLLAGERDGRPALDVFDPASGAWSPGYAGTGSGVLYAVTDGPSGPVATGNIAGEGGRAGLVVALEGDDTWLSITDAPGFDSSETVLHYATAGPNGYVATGYGPGGDSIVNTWWSADARDWEHLNAISATSEDGTVTSGIHAQDGVIDALVTDPTDGGFWAVQAGGTVWRSSGGRLWSAVGTVASGDDDLGFRTASAVATGGDLLTFSGMERAIAAISLRDGVADAIAQTTGSSMTVGAGATVLGDGTVMVPLEGPDGLFVWRGQPR